MALLALESSEVHFKQAISCIERLQSNIKKRLKEAYTKEVEKKFADILSTAKKGYLSPDEKVVAAIPSGLEMELAFTESLSMDQNLWIEGWKPEGLASRFINTLSHFKSKHSNALKLHGFFAQRKEPLSHDEVYDFEVKQCQIDIKKIGSKSSFFGL